MEQNENNNCHCKKFFWISVMTLVGSFLAFYVLMHQTMRMMFNPFRYSLPHYEKELKKDFKQAKNFAKNEFAEMENRISSIQTTKQDDEYVIVVDLKRFNNDENNIRFKIDGNTATVSGSAVKSKKNNETAYYFTESFEIPEKVELSGIRKEKVADKYIITIPIEN